MNFQPHKLKPLLMAPSPEPRVTSPEQRHPRSYPGEIIPRCTRIDSTAGELHSSMDVVENFECGQTHRQWKTSAIWPDMRGEFLILRHMMAAMDTKKVSLFNVPCKISKDERICGLYKTESNGFIKRGELILSLHVLSLPISLFLSLFYIFYGRIFHI